MHPELSPLLPVTDIYVGRSFGANMFLLEKGNNAEHRTGSPLTLATMADANNIRIGGHFDTQRTATAMRGFRYSTPPIFRAARLQEGRRQSDRLLSIVLLTPVALAQLPKSVSGDFAARCVAETVASLSAHSGPGNEADPQQSRGAAVTTGWCRADRESDRGRDAHCWTPPARIRTSPIRASGSYLGCLTAKQRAVRGSAPGSRAPGSGSG